jgi:predicted nucleic acid-binding protein
MAASAAFADTSFFFALAARQDQSHKFALKAFEKLVRSERQIVTTDYILDETLTLMKARTNSKTALMLLDRIDRSPATVIEWIGRERFESAKAFFRKHADHGYSFTDCTSFVLMRELKLQDALTTDRHFKEAGFRPLLPTIVD